MIPAYALSYRAGIGQPAKSWAVATDLQDVVTIITTHDAKLRRRHVARLYEFGSIARGEAHPDSDIDLLVEFDTTPAYDVCLDLKDFLEMILDHPVDLVTTMSFRPRLRPFIERNLRRVA